MPNTIFTSSRVRPALSFILVFGVTKALANYAAGRLADRVGRKHVLVAGWLVTTPVPFLLMWAPNWNWILFPNVLLGISQGLTWSTTVIVKVDLVGHERRGLAMGLNEFAGCVALAAAAWVTGWIAARYGLRPDPFYPGIAFAALGLLLSAAFVRHTRGHVAFESRLRDHSPNVINAREVFWRTTLTDRHWWSDGEDRRHGRIGQKAASMARRGETRSLRAIRSNVLSEFARDRIGNVGCFPAISTREVHASVMLRPARINQLLAKHPSSREPAHCGYTRAVSSARAARY